MKFDEIIGQEDIVRTLRRQAEEGKPGHAYIFEGEKGTGKKLLAAAFTEALGTAPVDIIEVTAEKPGGLRVGDIRSQVNSGIMLMPDISRYKVYIIHDAHLMKTEAQNALLKNLEEPPSFVVFLLLSENSEMLLPTIRSRSVTLRLRPLSSSEVEGFLKKQHAGGMEETALAHAAAFSRGSIGRAEELLQSESFEGMIGAVKGLMAKLPSMKALDEPALVKQLSGWKDNISEVLDLILLYLRDLLFIRAGAGNHLYFEEERQASEELAGRASFEGIEGALNELKETRRRIESNVGLERCLTLLIWKLKEMQ